MKPLLGHREFYTAIQKGVRTGAGKKISRTLNRWNNTLSADHVIVKFSPELNQFLIRYGFLDAGDSPEKREQNFQRLLVQLERSTGDARGVIGAWLHAFASGEAGILDMPICGERPQCGTCPLCAQCHYMATGARTGRISGKALERQLATDSESTGSHSEVHSAIHPAQPVSPETAELLAFTLSAGTGGAGAVAHAEALLKTFGGLRGLFHASAKELRAAGLDAKSAARLRSVVQLCQLWSQQDNLRGQSFTAAKDFFEHYHLRLRDLKKERFYTVCLDQKHRFIGDEMVSVGTLTEAIVHPREVFAPAIRLRAAAVAVLHNHPSGDPGPSKADRQLTDRLKEAADLIGIRLLDHVIVGDGKFFSFAEEGLL